jgi:DNA topoisomerase I
VAADPEVAAAVAAIPPEHPDQAAEAAGLVHVHDDEPGIARVRHGRGFTYRYPDGTLVERGSADRDRIEALVLPPAWSEVWICLDEDGHLQATGRDERDRKQYRYHDRWREVRDAAKFHRLPEFAGHLPAIRDEVDVQLRRRSMGRERVVAIVVALLDESLIRIGNACYATENGSYGLTTLTHDHVEVTSGRATFRFVGKSGREQEVDVTDRRLARAVASCEELPGQCLFSFEDDGGEVAAIESGHVNAWLREVTGGEFSAKDFRTWGGTVTAATTLRDLAAARDGAGRPSERVLDREVVAAVDAAAAALGNTRAVARDGYVHPGVLEAHRRGELRAAFRDRRARRRLDREETAVLRILEAQLR